MIDDKTPELNIDLPHASNLLAEDVVRLRAALNAIDGYLHAMQGLLASNDTALDTLQEAVDRLKAAETNITGLGTSKANASHGHAIADVSGLQGELDSIDNSFDYYDAQLLLKLNAATYTAADVLAKLLTVDGAGSGIDADLLDGLSSANFARGQESKTAAELQNNTSLLAGFYGNGGGGLQSAAGASNYLPGWWHVINLKHVNTDGYNAQLAVELNSTDGNGPNGARIYMRVAEAGVWAEWAPLDIARVRNGGAAAGTPIYAQPNDTLVMWAGNNVILPSQPIPGDRVVIFRYNGAACTVGRNGNKIMNLTEDLVIDLPGSVTLTLRYLEAASGWVIE